MAKKVSKPTKKSTKPKKAVKPKKDVKTKKVIKPKMMAKKPVGKSKKNVKPAKPAKVVVKPTKVVTKKPVTKKPKNAVKPQTDPFQTEFLKFKTSPSPSEYFPNMIIVTHAPTWASGYVGKKYIDGHHAEKAIKEVVEQKLNGTLKSKREILKQVESLIKKGEGTAAKEVKSTIGDTSAWTDLEAYRIKTSNTNNDWEDEI